LTEEASRRIFLLAEEEEVNAPTRFVSAAVVARATMSVHAAKVGIRLRGVGVERTCLACQNAASDSDSDIEGTDSALFQACLSGPGIAVVMNCAVA
jgi:hypothetical protein